MLIVNRARPDSDLKISGLNTRTTVKLSSTPDKREVMVDRPLPGVLNSFRVVRVFVLEIFKSESGLAWLTFSTRQN